jgi:hypothetical protein
MTPESGKLTLADRTVLVDVYEGPKALCDSSVLARGTFGTGARLGWVVTSSSTESVGKGARGKLTVNWEPGGAAATMPLPCDDFDCEPMELYPRIERHAIFNQTSSGTGALADISLEMVSLCYAAVHGATNAARVGAYNQISSYSNADQSSLGLLLVDKLRKGEETFYVSGMKYRWWFYTYTLPSNLTLGGIVQDPFGPGTVPSKLPAGLSWLRLADAPAPAGVNGSMYKITRTWIGGPAGHWDVDLY